MQLSLHCGWSCNKHLDDNNLLENDVYKLQINKNDNTPEANLNKIHVEEIIRNYNKAVFCLEVEGGVFFMLEETVNQYGLVIQEQEDPHNCLQDNPQRACGCHYIGSIKPQS